MRPNCSGFISSEQRKAHYCFQLQDYNTAVETLCCVCVCKIHVLQPVQSPCKDQDLLFSLKLE